MCEKQSKYVFSEGLIRHIHVFKTGSWTKPGGTCYHHACLSLSFWVNPIRNIRYAEILMHMAPGMVPVWKALMETQAAVGEYLSKYSCIDMKMYQ